MVLRGGLIAMAGARRNDERMGETGGFAGVVEGFYGAPWPLASRVNLLELMGRLGLNAYMNAPKDDPKHRAMWRVPYDPEELTEIATLVRAAERSGVQVIWALSPQRLFGGGDLGPRGDFDGDGVGDADWYALSYKLDQLSEVGVRQFALSFDDTWATFMRARASHALGQLHARVANRVLDRVGRYRQARVVLVPARYFGAPDELSPVRCHYARGLAEMWPDVITTWTGPRVFSTLIEPSDAERLTMVMRRPVMIWSNAIANDWLPLATGERVGRTPLQKLCFAPPDVHGVAPGGSCHGLVLNGAREVELTSVVLECFAAQLQTTGDYDGWSVLRQVLRERFTEETTEALTLLAELTQRHRYSCPDRVEGAALRGVIARYRDGRAGASEVESALKRQLRAARHLSSDLHGRPIWEEVAPSVHKMEHFAQAGLAGLAGRKAEQRQWLKRARAIRWLVASAGVGQL